MRVLNTSILALALFSLIGCGQLEKGKKNEKKKPTQKTVVSEEEMAARAEIYKDIPKTTFIRVEIDPETGAEKLDTAEIRHGKELLSSGEPTELAAAFDGAAVAKELEVASDHVSDDFDDALFPGPCARRCSVGVTAKVTAKVSTVVLQAARVTPTTVLTTATPVRRGKCPRSITTACTPRTVFMVVTRGTTARNT